MGLSLRKVAIEINNGITCRGRHRGRLVILPGEVKKGFWGEKMLDLRFEGWMNIEQGVQGWKNILN